MYRKKIKTCISKSYFYVRYLIHELFTFNHLVELLSKLLT